MIMLIIFDKDNTIVAGFAVGAGRPANTIDEQKLLPGVADKCAELLAEHHELAIASNQGGVAYGFISLDEAEALVAHAAELIGAWLYTFCPHHPQGKLTEWAVECVCRKPRPGMLIQLMQRADVDESDVLMIGDQESDRQAAQAAGVRFAWAKDFFGWE
jgi:D-glycero-D-manno-heptose 1,7-bisphosphate phosphatase